MLEDVLRVKMERAVSTLGVGVQELDDHDGLFDIAVLGVDESLDHEAKRLLPTASVHEVLHTPLAQQVNGHLQHSHAGQEQVASATGGVVATAGCCATGHEAHHLRQARLDALRSLVALVELLVLGD